ncbi:MAG: biosynthetic-type acetolactate synthase large subunit [Planctomycetes bacterium]|nr:biosynthetic-type acetolactate synthase large subunit [Planctomycetota bacterium]
MENSSSYIPPPIDGKRAGPTDHVEDSSAINPQNSNSHTGACASLTTGSERLIEILIEQGVNTIFGYPGGVVLPIFDALYKSPINFVLSRHEQGATHMADGYARASGKVGVVLVTSGPGATNIITGLATAYMDSIPMVAITGQVKTHLIGNDAFQEADTTGISRPVTKHNYIVKDANDLVRIVREAFYIAQTGRPGPVLIDVPLDVTTNMTEVNHQGEDMYLPGYTPRTTGHIRQIKKAAEAINQTEKTLVYAGGGVILADASAELRKLVNKANLPITTTLLGLGCYDERDPKSLHMLGMHGTAYANFAVQKCDLLVGIGARFDDRITGDVERFAPQATIIHIDIDPSSISKSVKVDIPVVGDAREILTELINYIEPRDRQEWFETLNSLKKQYPLSYNNETEVIKPQYVIEEICRQSKGEAIICTGVGQHQMWTTQFYRFTRPRHFLSSGGLGTMGYGFPAAIGAQIASPKEMVIDIDGDSSFSMTLQELPTAVENDLPVKVCVLNNGYMGMVRQWQELFYGRRYSKSYLKHPCFAKVAEAFGAEGLTAKTKKEVPGAVERMLATAKCCVVDFHVEPEENVWPMVATGKGLHEMDGLPTQSVERL